MSSRHQRKPALWSRAIPILTLMLVACTSNPPPIPHSNPIDDQSSALGLELNFGHAPDIVVFARLEEGVELGETFDTYSSTYAFEGYAYLMNAEPGTYVAVAATYDVEQTTHEVPGDITSKELTKTYVNRCYFSRDLIEHTRVTVEPGSFAFMGRVDGDQSRTFGTGDDCQEHFKELIEGPSKSTLSKFSSLIEGEYSRRVDLKGIDSSKQAKMGFLMKAKEQFATTGWVALIDAELAKVSGGS